MVDQGKRYGIVLLTEEQDRCCDLVPSNEGRSSLVSSLLKAFELHRSPQVDVISVREEDVGLEELSRFHGASYVRALLQDRSDVGDDIEVPSGRQQPEMLEELQRFGLLHDCPVFPYMSKYVRTVAASTLGAVDWMLADPESSATAINWYGGRHHAHRDKAAGFCYVNDIVLGISRLRTKFPRIMYIDFDLHHGDGVAKAFKFSDKVLTVSVHRHDLGFYPGTGSLGERGAAKGLNHDINLPMRRGLSSDTLYRIIDEILLPLANDKFRPDCIVVQCGCDGLSTDPHGEWNLTIRGFGKALERLMSSTSGVPKLLLGGGGYHHTEAAKFWTYLTAIVVNGHAPDWDEIPDHDRFDSYDSFQFWANDRETNMKDLNDGEWLNILKGDVLTRVYNI